MPIRRKESKASLPTIIVNEAAMSYHKNISFLLGAGASIPAGYSSTETITKLVTAPKGYFVHSDEKTYPGESPVKQEPATPIVRRVIGWLFDRSLEYFRRSNGVRGISYEELYFLVSQLADDDTEIQNPAILPFINRLKSDMAQWNEYKHYCRLNFRELQVPDEYDLKKVCTLARTYIKDIVIDVLGGEGTCFQHLKLIKAVSAAINMNLKLAGIATLAHDTHVETHLGSDKDINLLDGFSEAPTACGWRVWEDRFPESGDVPFVKLHGSVDWKHLEKVGGMNTPPSTVGKLGPPIKGEEARGVVYKEPEFSRPHLLIGTFNKPAQYSRGMMLDIHYRFRKILERTDKLVVCGYSFGDKAINTQIILWDRPGRSVVVIDPEPKLNVIKKSRFAAARFLERKTTQFITKRMEEICPSQLIDQLRAR